jgi:hypothetical protein
MLYFLLRYLSGEIAKKEAVGGLQKSMLLR